MQLSIDNISTDPVHLFDVRNISVSVLRLDKIHPVISGNKWFKLQYYLDDARQQQKKMVVTFGGAWSNHIVATSAACKMYGLLSAGIIRGEEPSELSPTLAQAMQNGMRLYFTSRKEYSEKIIPSGLWNDECYLINEGGYGEKGAEGASRILNYTSGDFTHCCCAVGTGTMMAGIIRSSRFTQRVIGISILKGNPDLADDIRLLCGDREKDWEINHDYHFGGYAKHTRALIQFMNDFFGHTNIPSDFVYTGKLFFAVSDLINNNFFPAGSKLLLIHSGGLQGNKSLPKGTLIY